MDATMPDRTLPSHKTRGFRSRVAAFVLCIFITGCARDDGAEDTSVESAAVAGTVTYVDGTPLGQDAVLEMQLLDVSTEDTPAVIGSQRTRNPGQIPLHFKLDYAADVIDPTHRYTVQARIFEGDVLRFATDTAYPVITDGNPQVVDVQVVPVGSAPAAGNTPVNDASAESTAAPPISGQVTTPAGTADYLAYLEGERLVRIEEERTLVDRVTRAEYQYQDGRLLRYIEMNRVRSTPEGGAGTDIMLDFAFDDTGELLAARKTIGEQPARPQESEIEAARNRADLLRSHALALQATRTHAH